MRVWLIVLLSIVFPLSSIAAPPGFMKERMGTVSGTVMVQGVKPMPGGIVSFFDAATGPPPTLTGARRIPVAVAAVNKDGEFSTKIVPGTYYIGALVITEPGRGPGPPRAGENFYLVVDEKGKYRQVEILTKKTLELGKVTVVPPELVQDSDTFMTIDGTIKDSKGKPFSDAIILVKTDPNSFRVAFASTTVNKDGTFQLKLPGGSYYLMARQVVGKSVIGRPASGSYIGVYGASVTQGPTPGSPGPPSGITPPAGVNQAGLGTATGIGPNFSGNTPVAAPLTGKAGDHLKNIDITVYPIQRPGVIRADGYFRIEGVVTDKSGKSVAGMQVHAKEEFNDFRPDFTSGATFDDGRFTLRLPAERSYYLLARQASMGPPEAGALVGIHGVQSNVKELLVFLVPGNVHFDELTSQAKKVTGKADEVVKDVTISVAPLGNGP